MPDELNSQHSTAILDNEPSQSKVADGYRLQSLTAAGQQGGRIATTLMLTGILMAVTMLSFEAVRRATPLSWQ